MKYLRNNGHL